MLHVVLYCPEIPQNTGNIGRLCAITESRLHLIHPLGFEITDRQLKRSGMDYWHSLDVHHHGDWQEFQKSPFAPKRIWLFSTHAGNCYWDASFRHGDGLLFGNEGHGCPAWLHQLIGLKYSLNIPHPNETLRSLNLSTAVGIAVYEGIRQLTRLS